MTKEQKLEACKMRLEGATLQAIAKKFGCTRQNIQQFLPKVNRPGRKANVVYPGIRDWLYDNEKTLSDLSRMAFGSDCANRLNEVLKGRVSPTKRTIDAILAATGLTYEEAFGGVEDRGREDG